MFQNSFRFTVKLEGGTEISHVSPAPTHSIVSLTINIPEQSGTYVRVDKATLTNTSSSPKVHKSH